MYTHKNKKITTRSSRKPSRKRRQDDAVPTRLQPKCPGGEKGGVSFPRANASGSNSRLCQEIKTHRSGHFEDTVCPPSHRRRLRASASAFLGRAWSARAIPRGPSTPSANTPDPARSVVEWRWLRPESCSASALFEEESAGNRRRMRGTGGPGPCAQCTWSAVCAVFALCHVRWLAVAAGIRMPCSGRRESL